MNDETQNVSTSQLNRMMLVLGLVVLAMCLLSAYAWIQLPDDVRIPVHWGIDGQPDRFGQKAEGLLAIPGVTLLICILFRVIPMIEPRRRNLLRSLTAYQMTAISIGLLMLGIHFATIGNLLGFFQFAVLNIANLFIDLMLIVIGNYLGKVRSNFLFGIRTPWTLSSELSWNKTHRLGGKLFVFAGSVGLLGQMLLETNAIFLTLVVLIISVIILLVYSYLVWRDDPDRKISA